MYVWPFHQTLSSHRASKVTNELEQEKVFKKIKYFSREKYNN